MKSMRYNRHRVLALLVAAAMLAAIFPAVLPVFAEGDTWAGDGLTEATAYPITDVADLAKLAENTNNGETYEGKYFRLTGDIDLTSYLEGAGNNGGAGWQPIGVNSVNSFAGYFDGDGHTISGLWISRPSDENIGLFGFVNGGTLKNLQVTLSDKGVTGKGRTGGLCGTIFTGRMEHCRAEGTVSIDGQSAGVLAGYSNAEIIACSSSGKASDSRGLDGNVGGLIGEISGGTVSACWSDAAVAATSSSGGLAGSIDGGKVSDCYATGSVSGRSRVGGLIGHLWNGSVYNSYALGNVRASESSGGALIGEVYTKYVSEKEVGGNYFSFSQTVNGSPAGENSGIGNGVYLSKAVGKSPDDLKQQATFADWDFNTVWAIVAGGASYPYLKDNRKLVTISTAQELAAFRDAVNAGDNHAGKLVQLAGDIDLTSYLEGAGNNGGAGWQPIGNDVVTFQGTFDGQGHTISGLWINRPNSTYQGLFGYVKDGTVKSLRVETAAAGIRGMGSVGVLTGYAAASLNVNCLIQDCYAAGAVTGQYSDVGGLVGLTFNAVLVENSAFEGTVVSSGGDATNCGGLIGRVLGVAGGGVRNCYATGSATADCVGGLIGWGSIGTKLQNCYAAVEVSGITDVGGLVGDTISSSIDSCYWDADLPQRVNGAARGPEEKLGVGSNPSVSGAAGKTTDEMKRQATFAGWDFDTVWLIAEKNTYPFFRYSDYPDYYLNGAPGNWKGGDTLTLDGDGAQLSILAEAGPESPVKIQVAQLDSPAIGIAGRPGVNYNNLYIEVLSDNTTLHLSNLELTAPEDKANGDCFNGICFTGDSTHTLSVSGECAVHAASSSYFKAGAVRAAAGSLQILGDALRATFRGTGWGYAVYADKDIDIKAEVDTLSDYQGVYAKGSLTVDGGKVTARGANGTASVTGLWAGGNLAVQNGSTVLSEPGGHTGTYYGVKGGLGVTVSDTATVTATGNGGGCGILVTDGGLTASGNAQVTATGGDYNAGSGGDGIFVRADGVVISDTASVTARGGAGTSETADFAMGGNGLILYNDASLTLNGGSLDAAGGSSAFGSGGIGVYAVEEGITVNRGQLTATGGDGVHGGQGAYSQLQMQMSGGTVTVNGGTTQTGNASLNSAGLYTYGLNVSGGQLTATGGDGIQSGGNDNDMAGVGIFVQNSINLTGGSTAAHGGTANYGGHGLTTVFGGVTVSSGANLEVIGGTGTKSTGGDGMSVGFNVITQDGSDSKVTIDNTAGNVYVRAGKNPKQDPASPVNARYVYIATGNVGRIDVPNGGEVKNEPGGGNVYLIEADTSPLAKNAKFESVVQTSVAGLSPTYTYSSFAKEDGVGYLWLPTGRQTISTAGYGDAVVTIPSNNYSAVTLHNSFTIQVNYKEVTSVRGTEKPAVSLGGSFGLTAPEGYALAAGVASALTLDSTLLGGGTVGGCAVTVEGDKITVDVPLEPLEIALTVTYKTADGSVKGEKQTINKLYNTAVTANDLDALPMGYALSGFSEFALSSGNPEIIFDFRASPKPTAEMDIAVAAKEYEITVTYQSGGNVGTCVVTRTYDSQITAEDLSLPAGYRLPDSFVNIPVTDENIVIPAGGSTGTLNLAVEPIVYTIQVTYQDGEDAVGTSTVSATKTIGQTVMAAELAPPAGYALKNFSGIPVNAALISTASGTDISVEVAVEVQKIALTVAYQYRAAPIGESQILNKDATDVLTEENLAIPFGYHLSSEWTDIAMTDSASFDTYQVDGGTGAALKTVQVGPNDIALTVHFLQGEQPRGEQVIASISYDARIGAADLTGMNDGYRLPDGFDEIVINESYPLLTFETDTSAVLTVQVVPAEYTVTIQYDDKAGSSYVMEQKTAYTGTIANVSHIPIGYGLDSFSGILLADTNQNVAFDHLNRTATVAVAVLPYTYTVTASYFDGTAFVGRQHIAAAYDSSITAFAPPAGYEVTAGTAVTVDASLSPDHKYRTADVNLQVIKQTYSVQITYVGEGSSQLIAGKQVGDSIAFAELTIPDGYSPVDFTDIYLTSALAATAGNGAIALEIPVAVKNVVIRIDYQAEDISVRTQILNVESGTLITADMLSVPYGYQMGTFDSVTAASDTTLEIPVCQSQAKSVSVMPGQLTLTLDRDKEGYLTAMVAPSAILDGSVSWESSNPTVATVDAYGKVTPVAKGSVVIKAISNQTDTVFAECMVTVLTLGDPYAVVAPHLTDWSGQAVLVTIDTYPDSDQTPGVTVTAKYKITQSASEPAYADDGSWTQYSGPVSVTDDGTHYIHWYAENSSGKSAQGVSNAYRIDTVLPEIVEAQAEAKSKSQIDLTAEAIDLGSGLYRYAWYSVVDGNDTLLSTNKAFSHTGLKSGTNYTYKLVVTDMAGNHSQQTLTAATNRSSSGGGGKTSSYTVTFDSRGGSKVDSIRVSRNGKLTKPADPVRDEYTFDGWFIDQACTQAYDFNSKVTISFTLYAKWAEAIQPPETWDNPFTDVKESDWFYDNVRYAYENKLFAGISSTLFAPDDTMSRAMLVTVLYRMAGEPSIENEILPFVDVDTDSWYGPAVYWARQKEIVNGYSAQEFAPDQFVSREEIAAIIKRYADSKAMTTDERGDLTKFTDEAQVSDWARESIEWAVGCGLISGKENSAIAPKAGATRAETAAILQRFLEMKYV